MGGPPQDRSLVVVPWCCVLSITPGIEPRESLKHHQSSGCECRCGMAAGGPEVVSGVRCLVRSLWKKPCSQLTGSEHPWDCSLGGGVITAFAADPGPVRGQAGGENCGSAGREGADS